MTAAQGIKRRTNLRMRKDFAVRALLACAAWSAVGPALALEDRIYWLKTYREAIREAQQTRKPIFLEFRCEA